MSQPEPPEADAAPGQSSRYNALFEPVEHPNEVVIAIGPEGSGKTHFAATAPGPLHVIGTEAGHEVATLVKSFPEKDIRHLALEPKADGDAEDIWFAPWFGVDKKMNQAVSVLADAERGTVVIDSASDLLGIAAASFNYQMKRGDDPIPPMMYGQLYPILDGWIGEIRKQHNVVMCSRIKDEYIDDSKTGEKVIDLWKTGPYLAESIIWISRPALGQKRVGAVTKGVNHGRLIYDPKFSTVTEPQPVEKDARPMRQALKRLKAAYKHYENKGLEAKRHVPDTLEGVKARIQELGNRLNGGGDDE